MKILYGRTNFRSAALEIIDTANEIIERYQEDGLDLTLRQLYYRFVAAGLIDNKESEYNKLGGIISKARLSGLIDWNSIVDRTREEKYNPHWDSPADIIEVCANQFKIDTRSDQEYYIEVWIEKDALIGVLDSVCPNLDITYFSCRGYVSQSSMWRAAQRIINQTSPSSVEDYIEHGIPKKAIILHLGDHDPSGVNMTQDIQNRLELFECPIRVKRIALNMDQIEEYNPPPQPAKATDSRYEAYQSEYGDESWELDALEPQVLIDLIKEKVSEYTDDGLLQERRREQREHRHLLQAVSDQWSDVVENLED